MDDARTWLSPEEFDRNLAEKDKVFDLCRGQTEIYIRGLPDAFEARFKYRKALHPIRALIQVMVDDGELVRVRRGFVGDAQALAP